jgi:hypothetical protein
MTDTKRFSVDDWKPEANLYLISHNENKGYDYYDSAVVCAQSESDARQITPGVGEWGSKYSDWCKSPEDVNVEYIGKAAPHIELGAVVCASFING